MKAAASTQLGVRQISTSLLFLLGTPFDDCLSAPDSEKPSATASATTAARARTRATPGKKTRCILESWLDHAASLQGSPRATLVNVEEQVDLLPPSLISGVLSSSSSMV